MAKPSTSKQSALFELNGSTLRTLLRDIRDGQISDEDERITAMHSLPFVQRYIAEVGIAELTRPQAVFRAIDQLWLKRHRPKRMTDQLSEEWLKFIYPEYIYFYPVRHNTFASPSISQALIELCDEEILVQLVTDGDADEIERLRSEESGQFFLESLAGDVSNDRLAAKSDKKIDTRIKRLFDDLAALIQPDPTPTIARKPLQPVAQVVESVSSAPASKAPFALAAYQALVDQQFPVILGYRPPACRYTSRSASQEIKDDIGVQSLLENSAVLISGVTGIGKTTYLTQVIMPACRELGLTPLFITLPAYFNARDKVGDLPAFAREEIFGQWHPAAADKDAFAHELAEARRERRVIWLLDGFDELTPRERGLLIQE